MGEKGDGGHEDYWLKHWQHSHILNGMAAVHLPIRLVWCVPQIVSLNCEAVYK